MTLFYWIKAWSLVFELFNFSFVKASNRDIPINGSS